MKELVSKLVKLQEYDTRLNELKLKKGDLPQIIETIDEDLQDKQSTFVDLEEKTSRLQSDRKMFEKEAEASKAQLKKYEEQLYSVQNNKEYDAISLEIDTKKAELESLENKILQTIEDEEEISTQLSELSTDVSELTTQLAENKEELEEIDKLTRKEEAKLRNERDDVAKKIDDRHLSRYERIHGAKEGLAVVTVQKASCGGCFSAVPPQRIIEIRKTEQLHTCENCGRLIVWTD